jgi:predicted esterase
MVLLHGRGGTAQHMQDLAQDLLMVRPIRFPALGNSNPKPADPSDTPVFHTRFARKVLKDFLDRPLDGLRTPAISIITPQAANNTWYPAGFMAPASLNQPFLDESLALVDATLAKLYQDGYASEQIILGGFSQGACLALEYAVRHPRRYAGLLAFSGGLIGVPGTAWPYPPLLAGTPAVLSVHEQDPHIPLSRWQESMLVLAQQGAVVSNHLDAGFGHGISQAGFVLAQTKLQDVLNLA